MNERHSEMMTNNTHAGACQPATVSEAYGAAPDCGGKGRGMSFGSVMKRLLTIAVLLGAFVLQGWFETGEAQAAVAHDVSSESHTGTTGSTNQASFTWNHAPTGTPRGVVVFVYTISATDTVTSVTYGGTTMTRVTGGAAIDTATEPGRVDTFFLGASVPTGTQAVVVNRTNNATIMYATATTVTAARDTEPTGIVLLQEDGTFTGQSVDDGTPGSNSLRVAAGYSGGANVLAGASTTTNAAYQIDFGNYTATTGWETTAGQGARTVGFTYATSDDRAAVHLAVREVPLLTVGNGTNPANANAYRGSLNNALDAFTLSVSAGSASVTALTVTGSANFTATNIPTNGVKIYRDAGTIGTFDAADTLISSGSTAVAGNATTVTLTAAESVTTTAANYLVVVDINQGATSTNTFTGTISAVTGSGFGATTDSDAASATLTVTASTLTAGNGTTPAAANVTRSSTNNLINSFTLQMNGGSGTVTSLTVLGTGSFNTTNIPTGGVKVWRDLGTVGVLDGADVQISTASTAIATLSTTVTISNEVVTTTAVNYLVTVDITAGATIGNTFTATISNAGGTNLGTLVDNDTTSATLTIVTPTLTIGNGTNPASANAPTGTTGNALDGFTLQMNGVTGSVTSFTVLGSANFTATNIPTNGVKIYRDAGTPGTLDGADTLISSGSTAITANATTVSLTAAETVSGTAANYLVVVDITAGATVTNTFTATISGAAGTNLGTPVDNDTTSATLTIVCFDATPSTITIPALQTASGDPYNAAALKTTTGNVGTLQYKAYIPASGSAATVTYYVNRDTTTNLTADGTCNVTGVTPYTSTGRGKTTTVTTESAGASRYYPTIPASTATRAFDVYGPIYTSTVNISNISASAALRGLAATDTVKLDLYDYDPNGAANNGTLVATGATKTLTGGTTTTQYTWTTGNFTINGSGAVKFGHRLQFRFTWTSGTAGTPRIYFGGGTTTTSTNFTVTQTPVDTICTDWTATATIPATTAGGSQCGDYTNGGTYTLDVKGTDPDCGNTVTTTPTSFTWSSCSESATLTAPNPAAPITGPVAITAGGTATGIQVSWSTDGGTSWSAWVANGSTFTPSTCTTGNVLFRAQGTGICGTVMAQSPTIAIDTTDKDLATITVTPSGTVTSQVTVQATIGVETAPESLQNVVLNITGSTACNVSNGVMTWNAGSSKWEYLWDTSACGGPSPAPIENGVSVQVSGTDPDCNDFVTGSATVSIDNQCDDTTSTVSWTPPGTTVTAPLVVTAVLSGGTPGSQQVSFDDGTTWKANNSTFTPVVDGQGTASFRVRALDVCGKYIYGGPYAVTWDGRLPRVRPLTMAATAAGKTSIQVIMTYCSDNNNNAQTSVSYKLTSAADLPANWTTVGPAVDGQPGDADGLLNQSVMFMLTGLTTDTSYDIKLTMTDADGVDWTTIQSLQATAPPWTATVALSSWLDSPLLHNALRFACSTIGYADQTSCEAAGGTWNLNRKWTGGWGVPKAQYPGAKYDGFECGTCHVKNSSNIKRVITAVAPKADGPFPGSTVALQDVREGTAEFGDDSDNHTSSNRVCEACHSQTTYHRQDTTAQTNKQHNNKADCVRCHEHNVGFRASCDSCHGTPPVSAQGLATTPATTGSTVWGEHQKHAVDLGFECKTCHNGWDGANQMPNGGNLNIGFKADINPRFNGHLNTVNGGTYEGRPTPGGKYTGDGTTATSVTQDTVAVDMTCAVYCHGYGRPEWNPTSTQPCGSCHGKVNSGVGYRSGAPTGVAGSADLSGATTGLQVGKHVNHLDDSVAQTGDPCALCHSGFSYTDATHVNGTVNILLRQNAKIDGSGTTGGAGVGAYYDQATGSCKNMECHGDTPWDSAAVLNCTQSCHNYPPVGVTAGLTIYSGGTPVNPVSHVTPNGVQYLKDNHGGCKYCHGWNDNGSGALPISGMTASELTTMNGDPLEAPNFTTYANPSNLNGLHMDGSAKITMNDDGDAILTNDADYDPLTGGCDNAVCHGNDTAHRFPVGTGSGNTIVPADIGPGDCAACHTTGVGGATIVTPTSPHTKVTVGGAFTGCGSCHSGHYVKPGGVQIPNNPAVGINYTGTQHGGIKLGGPGTDASISSKTTEAEICWGCHSLAANNISEFGTNTKMTGSPTYNQYNAGTLSNNAASAGGWYAATTVGSETGATWTSAKTAFAYKTGAIQSIHTANSIEAGATSTVTGSAYAYKETLDKVALIRCSYCHDVHDAGGIGVGPTGKPYLRGTWWSNPYEEDGAPQSGTTFNNISEYGAVPRGGTSSTAHQRTLGGFWIDINNVQPGTATTTALSGTAFANPTATGGTGTGGAWTLSDSAGLCTLCHTNNVDTMNWNTTETNLWFGTNGHSNAVIGGSGTASGNAANIFNLRGGTAANNSNPAMHFRGANAPGDSGTYGYRNNAGSAANYTPYISPTGENTLPYSVELWGTLNYDNTTTQNQYHKFPCAKCHNPHASRLPKLMITNCLDTKHNTWDDAYQLNTRNAAATSINYNRSISNWSTAQNCHRVGGIIPANRIIPATGGTYAEPVDTGALEATKGTTTDYKNRGWNTVTPW